ncbi:TnsD family Tn7-like transposition protein [Clostridium gasigenes]|uniref:TniQ protein n=1 Tax=Clostridium gasigenes TaxID=94869 RepID=A0A1H0S3P6_9CLOT|nr:TnsD family Tn7-like transposition protein [Clostridium gasigenes]SDP35856.1 TniQ protein [Clostridium gasigenes]
MLNFFPRIYEGELLYSVISRYRIKAVIVNKRALMKDLYGEEVTLNSVYFPVHIKKVVKSLPINTLVNADEIIKKNTLFKVFTAFLDKERKDIVYKGMLECKKFNAYQPLGIVTGNITMKDKLYFCEECLKEDILKYGESYWGVINQVPGVYTCNKHKVALIESEVSSSNSRVEYSCLNKDIKGKKVVERFEFININLKYTNMVEDLYRLELEVKDKEFFDSFYIDRLREKGFTSKNGSIKLIELEEAFIDFYSQEYLNIMQSSIKVGSSWLRLFIRTSNKQKHVLRHLLMIHFLGLTIEGVFNTKEVKGKVEYIYIPNPRLDRDIQRERWLQVLKDNPGLNKSGYKKIGKGLYSWMYKNDNIWFERTTPKKYTK